MNSKEIRIGNRVMQAQKIDANSGVWKEIVVTAEMIADAEVHPQRYAPLPLTSRVLEVNFHAICPYLDGKMIIQDLCFLWCKNEKKENYLLLTDDGFKPLFDDNKIFFVHQLQNLYFHLRGKELTISL